MRWAHKFGPAEHVQLAEHFLLERMRLMLTVRAPKTWSCALTPHQAEIASQHSGVLQAEELRWHQSTDYDILFECWAVADRLNLHALAAECEWGLTQLWETKHVYMRAALDLSPGALQRIARSLCAGKRHAYQQFQSLLGIVQNPKVYSVSNRDAIMAQASIHKLATESAHTMLQWRMSKEE